MTNYTKGEWKSGNTDVLSGHTHIANCFYESRNFKRPSFDEALANARLISQAPAMYGVIRQFVRYCEQWERANGEFPNGDGRILILKNMRDVLSKIEGATL